MRTVTAGALEMRKRDAQVRSAIARALAGARPAAGVSVSRRPLVLAAATGAAVPAPMPMPRSDGKRRAGSRRR